MLVLGYSREGLGIRWSIAIERSYYFMINRKYKAENWAELSKN